MRNSYSSGVQIEGRTAPEGVNEGRFARTASDALDKFIRGAEARPGFAIGES